MSQTPASDETIFAAALERPAAERAAYLNGACEGDAARRQRIEELLRVHDRAGKSFMHTSPVAAEVKEIAAGTTIGRYKLLQKIGEGGCGVVYMAEQEEPVRRRVALKVIKLGMDTKEVVARFEAERQALALMDHPNIARVFDGGATESGRPFFVMELVRGVPVTKFCDEQNLPTRARLELFTSVCHAVQHAHQKGIIHRDLKPSNILVTLHDGKPVPKVIDFGIAKATAGRLTDNTLFTAFEQFIGTPAYMSPEQAEMSGLDIDTRSDIYSLGVLLYELLTGRPPFDPKSLVSAGLDEIRRIIREVDPPRMSTRLSTLTDLDRATIAKQRGLAPGQLSSLLRGDLDWIVMRCLEKDRTRRYETASSLAADLVRHLADKPVSARPPSAFYRVQKFVRRHRLAVVAAVLAMTTIFAAASLATWQAIVARKAEQAANGAREVEQRARQQADARRREAEAATERARVAEARSDMARQDALKLLIDMHTAAGLTAAQLQKPQEATLWFSRATLLSQGDPNREVSNRERFWNWSQTLPTPVRALSHRTTAVLRLQFDPSGHYLLCETDEGRGAIWDWLAEQSYPLPPDLGRTGLLDWSADGKLLGVAGDDGRISLLNFPGGSVAHSFRTNGKVTALAFSPDGRWLAAGSDTLKIWNLSQTVEALTTARISVPIATLTFAPDSLTLVAAGEDGLARVISLEGGVAERFQPLRHLFMRYPAEFGTTTPAPVFVNNGRTLIVLDTPNSLKCYDAFSGRFIRTIQFFAPSGSRNIKGAAVTADRRKIVLSGYGVVESWRLDGAGREQAIKLEIDIGHVAHAHATNRVALSGWNGEVRLWDSSSEMFMDLVLLHQNRVHRAAFAPNDRYLATAQQGGLVRIWDLAGTAASPLQFPQGGYWSNVRQSNDGNWIVAAGSSYSPLSGRPRATVTGVIDANSGTPGGPIIEMGKTILDADCIPATHEIIALGYPSDLQFFDWRTGAATRAPMGLPAPGRSVHVSPDGKQVAILCENAEVLLLDATSRNPTARLAIPANGRMSNNDYLMNGLVRFSPDGKSLVVLTKGKQLSCWDVATAQPRFPPIEHGALCHDFEWSPDAHLLATASYDDTARVFDFATGAPVSEPLRHPDHVFRVRFMPGTDTIVTACRDGMIRKWNWAAGRVSGPPARLDGEVFDIRLLSAGKIVAATGSDKSVRLFEIETGKLLSPPWTIDRMGFSLVANRAEKLLFIGGSGNAIVAFPRPEHPSGSKWTGDDILAWGELLSGQTVILDGGVVNLTAQEWIERWRSLRIRHPEFPVVNN